MIDYLKNLLSFRNKEKIFVFLICLMLSSLLWFLNSLEKHYTDRISVPLKYINIPKNKKSAGILPNKLDMTVDASGYIILQYKLRLVYSPITLDINELTDNYLEDKYISKYAISTNDHKAEFAKQISNDMQIMSIRPDSIFFNMSPLVDRKIKVHPNVKLTFYKEFTLKRRPFTNPDSVWVRGPKNILDTLKKVNTKEYRFDELSHNLLRKVNLDLSPELACNTKEVLLNIPVEQYTEVTFDIPVNVINIPDSLTIKTFPSKVKVSCRIGISEYNKLSNNSFKAIINFKKRSLSMSRLPVQLNNYLDTVLSADYYPKEVEYVIEQKK
jgi:hypothetical protein